MYFLCTLYVQYIYFIGGKHIGRWNIVGMMSKELDKRFSLFFSLFFSHCFFVPVFHLMELLFAPWFTLVTFCFFLFFFQRCTNIPAEAIASCVLTCVACYEASKHRSKTPVVKISFFLPDNYFSFFLLTTIFHFLFPDTTQPFLYFFLFGTTVRRKEGEVAPKGRGGRDYAGTVVFGWFGWKWTGEQKWGEWIMSVQDDPWHTCSYYSWCSIGVSITLHNARITLGIAVLCCDTSQMFGWCSSSSLFHRPIFLPL